MNIKIIITSCMLAALSACGGGSSTPADNGPPPVSNTAPVANPGTAQSVVAGMPVMLDGSASSDANGDALTYAWALSTKPAGSAAVLVAATTAKPTFTADVAGTYVLTLTVNDGKVGSAPVSVTVTAAAGNAAPVANAGPAQTVLTGTRVMLDGRASSDANGDVLTFAWVLTSKPSGSNTTLSGTTLAQPAFTPDVAGTYVATLIVGDGKLTSTGATVSVTVTQANIAPVANAGVTQTIMTGAVATLDGSGSSDANGDTLSYAWVLTSRPVNSSAVLTSATSARPTFTADMTGVYVATLRVNDGKLDSVAATVTITATSSGTNTAPIANAGSLQYIRSPIGVVTLDGSASYDADGDPLTYKWTLVSSPTPTRVPFNGTTLPVATLAPASGEGVYVISLVVNDGKVDSAPSTTTVTSSYTVNNNIPFANAGPEQNLISGNTARLNGLGSSDSDGDPLTYKWYLKSRPSGSNATVSSATSAQATFVADIAGTYVATLIVNDGKMNSSESNVTIKVQ